MATTPNWSAPRSGLLGDTGAVDASAQINQFLGTHASTEIYQGSPVVTPAWNGGHAAWQYQLSTQDIAQPFTMSGTTIGRVVVPLLAVGNGADLIVSLYTDSSGVPGTLVTRTRIPANWITQLSAVTGISGPSSIVPTMQYTNNPLALGQFNTYQLGVVTSTPWPFPTSTGGFSTASPSATYYANYMVLIGGVANSIALNNVYSIPYDGAGNLSIAIPQPPFPVTNDGSSKTCVAIDSVNGTPVLVNSGGGTAFTGPPVTSVYTAPLNLTNGSIGAWTQQTSLGYAVQNHGTVSYNGFVYIVGGLLSGATLSTVSYGQVQNGQISTWNTGAPLPVAMQLPYVAAVDGFLMVMGGADSGFTGRSTFYYAPINANGSLGTWQINGPQMPGNGYNQNSTVFTTKYGVISQVDATSIIGVSPNGVGNIWNQSNGSGGSFTGAFDLGNGAFVAYGLSVGSTYNFGTYSLTPYISVPLPSTGLTNTSTYHIVLNQPNGDANNYLRTHDVSSALPGNPTILARTKGSTAWVAGHIQYAVPIQVYDLSASGVPGGPGGQAWHFWDDGGARITTVAYATTPDRRVLGSLDAVAQPGPVLNMNPAFTAGTPPWVATNASVARSNAFTHGELPYSALVTPTGGVAASIQSEQVSVSLNHAYTVTAWLYSPGGFTGAAVNVNWYAAGVYSSTTSGTTVTLAAGVWQQVTVSGTVPNIATPTATVVCIETGTPTSGNTFYVSAATIQDNSGPMLGTVSQVTYSGTWPTVAANVPTGTTQLA